MRDIRPIPNSANNNRPEPVLPLPPTPATPPVSDKQTWQGNKVPVTSIKLAAPTPAPAASPPRAPRMRIGHRERTVVVALLCLLVLASILAALIFLPHASLQLTLRTAPLLVDEELQVTAATANATQAIPGSAFFREVAIEGNLPVVTTQVIGTKSGGTVTIVNKTIEEQKIKERSRLTTADGTLFYMLRSVSVPPNSSAPVPVEAAEAGEGGNIAPARLNFAALDASSQSLVYGENKEALKGGSGETVQVIAETDIDAAKKDAGQQARSKVEQEIRESLPAGWTVLEESWTSEIASFTSTVKIGERQPTIPYQARVVVRVLGLEKTKLEEHLRVALEQRLQSDYMLFPGPISYTTSVKEVDWEKATATIATRVTHTTIPRFSIDALREKLSGRSELEAKQYLEGLPGVRSVTIDLSPFWVQSIPRIHQRISLDLQPEQAP